MKIKIPGTNIDAEVRSEEECAKADFFVAAPKYQSDANIKAFGNIYPEGSKGGYYCQYCKQECFLAPSGQRIEAMGLKVTCSDCMMKVMKEQS